MFRTTYNLLSDLDITFLHVFPYSPRPGTPAARMPQVASTIIKQRAAQLRSLGEKQLASFAQRLIGKEFNVLLEKDEVGKTDHFVPIHVPLTKENTVIKVRATGLISSGLQGERI
jgi:threonylcarbamoyladenosine tRNA methylthiotransferase MtaB